MRGVWRWSCRGEFVPSGRRLSSAGTRSMMETCHRSAVENFWRARVCLQLLLRLRVAQETVVEAAPPMRVLVAGGHPDDPESGCGGTIARYVQMGHEVTVLYLTRGEAGIKRKTHDEAAAIRSARRPRHARSSRPGPCSPGKSTERRR